MRRLVISSTNDTVQPWPRFQTSSTNPEFSPFDVNKHHLQDSPTIPNCFHFKDRIQHLTENVWFPQSCLFSSLQRWKLNIIEHLLRNLSYYHSIYKNHSVPTYSLVFLPLIPILSCVQLFIDTRLMVIEKEGKLCIKKERRNKKQKHQLQETKEKASIKPKM